MLLLLLFFNLRLGLDLSDFRFSFKLLLLFRRNFYLREYLAMLSHVTCITLVALESEISLEDLVANITLTTLNVSSNF